MVQQIALIGFGEAGATFARAAGWGGAARAYDVRPERSAPAAELGVQFCPSAAAALAGADLVLSLVTADAALAVARDCAPLIAAGALWCDMNSVSPDTKRAAAAAITAAGGRYVDVAVLAPVDPARLNVPLLLAGDAADAAAVALAAAGFVRISVVGAEIGRASAIKLIRSVMVKGIEALTAEMMLASNRAGVGEAVLASLDASERHESWFVRAAYNLDRMAQHGERRAAEMEHCASTLDALGVAPLMTRATVERQRAAAGTIIPSPPPPA